MRQATKDRQSRVMTEVQDRKHVTVRELADNLRVSEATIRRDLRVLAEEQRVSLVHGGARRSADHSFAAKHDRNLTAKRAVAELASQFVDDGSQLFLDSGTTCFEIAPYLANKQGLSVILNSARLALEFKAADVHIMMLGGRFRQEHMDCVGPISVANLKHLRGYRAFIGADGLSMEVGPAAIDMESAHLYQMAIANAQETYLLVDHTKFQAPSLFRVVEWEEIDHVITDRPPAGEWAAFFAERNIPVHFPETTKTRGHEVVKDHEA